MNGLISRQAAIDALGGQPTWWSYGEYEAGLISQWKSDVEKIRQLPSAEPETGEWIDTDNYYRRWKCSKCGCHAREDTPYCPFCGRYNGGGFGEKRCLTEVEHGKAD